MSTHPRLEQPEPLPQADRPNHTTGRWRRPVARLLLVVLLGLLAAAVTPGTAQAASPPCLSYGTFTYGQKGTLDYRWINTPIAEEGYQPGPINQPPPLWTWRCSLRKGYNSYSAVWHLQRSLNKCYYPNVIRTRLAEDGSFGPKTKSALITVQRYHGINDDGQYGPQTAATLNWPGMAATPYGYLEVCLRLRDVGVS